MQFILQLQNFFNYQKKKHVLTYVKEQVYKVTWTANELS